MGELLEACACCGSVEDLGDIEETGVPFCAACWDHGHLSEHSDQWDDLGGGD